MQELAILETADILTLNWSWLWLIAGGLALEFIGIAIRNEVDFLDIFLCLGGGALAFVGLLLLLTSGTPSGYQKHKVYVDNVETAVAISEKYKILKQEDNVWTITTKDFPDDIPYFGD